MKRTRLIVTATLLSLTGLACAPGHAQDVSASTRARLADQVPTPVLHWTTCQKTAQCATAELPLHYDDPHGATITLALLRIKAADPRHRLGTLFVNPGGPGDPATDFAALIPQGVPKVILDRFDIV